MRMFKHVGEEGQRFFRKLWVLPEECIRLSQFSFCYGAFWFRSSENEPFNRSNAYQSCNHGCWFIFREATLEFLHPFSSPAIIAGTQLLQRFSPLLSPPIFPWTWEWALQLPHSSAKMQPMSQCHSLRVPAMHLHTQTHSPISQWQRDNQKEQVAGVVKTSEGRERPGQNLSGKNRQPCRQQRGRTPDANYADKWCRQLVNLATIYSLGDPNYHHSWRTNRQCAEWREGSSLPRSKTRVIWCLLTLAACIISVLWQPHC